MSTIAIAIHANVSSHLEHITAGTVRYHRCCSSSLHRELIFVYTLVVFILIASLVVAFITWIIIALG